MSSNLEKSFNMEMNGDLEIMNNLEEFLEIRVDSIGLNSSLFFNTENYIFSEKMSDFENMNYYLDKAIKMGSVDALFYLGNYYDEIKNYPKMVHFYEKAAEKNDLDSIYNLSLHYKEQNNKEKRKFWLEKGVELEDPDCMCSLAEFYDDDYHALDKEEKIKKYYDLAIKLKYLKAYYLLGMWYFRNDDPDERIYYFQKAVDDFRYDRYLKNKVHKNVYIDEDYNVNLVIKMMLKIADYYETEMYDHNNAVRYYMYAISHNSIQAMYNLGSIYMERGDTLKMKKYFLMAIELNDIDSMFELAIYYQNVNDIDNFKKYYLMALNSIENAKNIGSLLNDGIKDFNIFKVKEILETVVSPSDYVVNKLQNIKRTKEIIIFENKKNLFTQLNNIVECGICYEVKLNIDLSCGHCCCTNCYPHLYNKSCPFCRL